MTAKVALAGDQGDSPSRSEVGTEPSSEGHSQLRAFMKEVSTWISECKAWNVECKVVRAKNAQAGTGTGNQNWRGSWTHNNEGSWTHNSGQGWTPQCQPNQRGEN